MPIVFRYSQGHVKGQGIHCLTIQLFGRAPHQLSETEGSLQVI